MTEQADIIDAIGAEPGLSALQARAACVDLVVTTARLVSAGLPEQTFELFTDDYQLVRNGITHERRDLEAGARSRGHDGVRRLHIPSQSSFRLVSSDTAETETDVAIYVFDEDVTSVPAPRALVHASDSFSRGADGSWRMSRRTVSVIAGSP
jgi:SnoaL-like domain